MPDVPRVKPSETRERVLSGEALLVCAYDDEEKFATMHLEGAVSLAHFRQRLLHVPKSKEIVFYCS
ncbi:MAG: rhodanese-like domain-containing protein [Geobacter sp.]|nr:rhodanese-like domain-containing protein [Geobacter sp.]